MCDYRLNAILSAGQTFAHFILRANIHSFHPHSDLVALVLLLLCLGDETTGVEHSN